jgi:hypothetical protein
MYGIQLVQDLRLKIRCILSLINSVPVHLKLKTLIPQVVRGNKGSFDQLNEYYFPPRSVATTSGIFN